MIYVLFVISLLYSIYLFILLKKENKFEKEIQVDFISFDDIVPDEEFSEKNLSQINQIDIDAIKKEICLLKKMIKAMMIIVSITLLLILIILFKG